MHGGFEGDIFRLDKIKNLGNTLCITGIFCEVWAEKIRFKPTYLYLKSAYYRKPYDILRGLILLCDMCCFFGKGAVMQRKREKPAVLENVFLQQAFSKPSATVRGGRKALKRQDGFPVLYNTRFLQKIRKYCFLCWQTGLKHL